MNLTYLPTIPKHLSYTLQLLLLLPVMYLVGIYLVWIEHSKIVKADSWWVLDKESDLF